MPMFEYKAVSPTGQIVTATMESANEQGVTKELFLKGFKPISVAKKKVEKEEGESSMFQKKIKTEEIVLFTRQLVTLLRAGVPMLTAMEALNLSASKGMSAILDQIYVDIMSGKSFSQALDKHPKVFSKLFVNSVYAGEMSGSLDEVLDRMATVLKHDEETNKKVKGALKYPIFVIVAMTAAFIVLMTMVIPNFASLFQGMGMELPLPTKILMGLSDFVQNNLLLILGTLGGGFAGFKMYTKTEKGRLWWDSTQMKIPLIGPIVLKTAMARFTTMFETLNKSGLPILQTLKTVSGAVGNKVIENTIKNVAAGVERGEGIAGAMKRHELFPKIVLSMVSIGEQSGSLDEMLGSIARHYDAEVEHAIKGMTAMIEPILTVIIAGAVIVLALGIFLPMWSMVGAIQ